MKKVLLAFIAIGFLSSCKGDKVSSAAEAGKASSATAKTATTTGPAVRDGNVIRQKITVGGDQTLNMNIDAATALSMIKNNPAAKIIDVRTPSEVADGTIANALHIDFNGSDFQTEINKLDKKDTYIVYCKSGGRSKKAVNMMRAFGYDKSFNMKEGYKSMAKAIKN